LNREQKAKAYVVHKLNGLLFGGDAQIPLAAITDDAAIDHSVLG
jgi:hypothetical protein